MPLPERCHFFLNLDDEVSLAELDRQAFILTAQFAQFLVAEIDRPSLRTAFASVERAFQALAAPMMLPCPGRNSENYVFR